MKNKSTSRVVGAAAGLGVWFAAAAVAGAQPPADPSEPSDSVNVDVSDCLELETREQQIACYLARVDEAVEARETAAADAGRDDAPRAPSPAVQAEARRPDTPAPRAQSQPQPQPQPQRPAEPAPAAEPAAAAEAVDDEIVATITSLRELQPDTYVINLDNGQIWRQSSPKRYFLREGAEVHLVPTRWGESYRLTDPNVGNFIQVERVR